MSDNLYDGMIPGAEPWADMMESEAIVRSIRKALRGMAENIAGEFTGVGDRDVGGADVLAEYLPASLVAWVMEADL